MVRFELRSHKDFAAGCLFFTIGSAWAAASTAYRIGRATAMGPGYFPLIVALILAVLGLCSIVRAVRVVERDRIGPWPYQTIFFVIGGVVGFGVLLETAGLLVAAAFLLAMGCWSRWRSRFLETALLTVFLIALVSGVFVYGLGITIDLY